MTTVALHHRIDAAPDLPGDAPTVVLAGSLGSTLEMWDAQARVLSARFRVVRFDTRGHGRSPVPDEACSIEDLADDLLVLLDRLELGTVHLAGLSLGGMTAMALAARHPERVDALALLCTSALLGPRQGWLDRAAAVRAGGTSAVADVVVTRWFSAGYPAAHPDRVLFYRDMIAATPAAGYASCCEAIGEMDLRAALPQISAPTLAIAGAQDPATPPEHLRLIAGSVPGARLLMLDPAAHLANVEQADQVNTALLEHFSGSTVVGSTVVGSTAGEAG